MDDFGDELRARSNTLEVHTPWCWQTLYHLDKRPQPLHYPVEPRLGRQCGVCLTRPIDPKPRPRSWIDHWHDSEGGLRSCRHVTNCAGVGKSALGGMDALTIVLIKER